MNPNELNKTLTILLNEMLKETGFSKKKTGKLIRKKDECEQVLSFYFTKDRDLSGKRYTLTINLSFSFTEVNKLTSKFLGEEYDAKWATGAQPLYAVIPDKPLAKYKYYADDPLSQFAKMVADDFRLYAINFYDRYDTVNKLENYFDQDSKRNVGEDEFRVVLSGKQGSGRGCCIAAVLCVQGKWDKLQMVLKETDLLLEEQRECITEHILNR